MVDVESHKERQRKEFAHALRDAMRRQGVTGAALSRRLGCSSAATVGQWAAGLQLPRVAQAERLADALHEPELLEAVICARGVVCQGCEMAFVNDSPRQRRFHSRTCARKHRRAADQPSESEVARLRTAVATMCQGCAPEGACPIADCALRPVSPLPLRSAMRQLRLVNWGG